MGSIIFSLLLLFSSAAFAVNNFVPEKGKIGNYLVDSTSPADGKIPVYDSFDTKFHFQAMSGDITMTKAGVVTIANSAVSFSELSGQISNGQVPDTFTRDSEV